jgi:acyl-CoA synthetase (AMP-forming)/AMP-acid ligase II
VHRATLTRFSERFFDHGLRSDAMLPVYGLAEATLGVAFEEHGRRAPDLAFRGRAVPSVGRPLAGMEIEIRGPRGELLPAGAEGEIAVRGPSLMDGYFGASESSPIEQGWLKTGDLGVIQGGALYVTGREKDLVIKAGQKFHPYEIERVAEGAVAGAPNCAAAFARRNDETGTEDLVVMVELCAADAAGAERTIRGALLDALDVRADRILIVRPGELPRTTSGKIRRGACREMVVSA